jgi:homoserine O-acetyltransferase
MINRFRVRSRSASRFVVVVCGCLMSLPRPLVAQGSLSYADLGECPLESGAVIEDCRLAYRTFGQLNADRSNAVLFPTQFMGTSATIASYVGSDGLVDDSRYFIIAVDAFGNGVSSSPSNSRTQPVDSFPQFTIRDMAAAQHRLVTEVLHLTSLRGVVGISMGGMQAFEWSVGYPGFAEKIVSIASSPRLASYDLVLWETVLRILAAYEACQCREAVAALMGVNFLMAHSPAYSVRTTPRDSVAAIVGRMDSQLFAVPIGANIASQVRAMIGHDVSTPYGGDMARAAARVRAQVLVIVTPEDHVVTPWPALEWAELLGGEAVTLSSDCGHNGLRCDAETLSIATQRFLDERPDKLRN